MKHHVLFLSLSLAFAAQAVERWGVFELSLNGPASGNPNLEVQWSATFTQGDRRVTVPGFWDIGGTHKLRFSPPTPGEWRYETRSATPELNGNAGSFTAAPPTVSNHGPVEVFNTFYLRYADGAPNHQFGTTCYAWVHQTRELQEQTLKTLAASPFNKLRFCVFPNSYAYNKNEPEFFAFQKGADGKFDFSRPDPAFWRHFEQRILDLQKLGIEADLILWHPYDRWGFADMSDAEDDRYLRYCIARLGAFRNVWWSLANEYDFMTEQRPGHRGNKQWDDWDRFFAILQKEDPHQRLRGIHNGSKWYDHTKDWVTHASLQTSDMNRGVSFREQYRKPVVYDECKYEGNIPQGWGNLTAREMAQRFWLGTMSGCYVGHGETYQHPEDILWWAKGGVLHGESPKRIQWLKDLMAQAPPFHELKPLGDDKGRFLLAKPGEYYLVYCLQRKPETIELTGPRPYKVDTIDPWAMTVTPAGTARPGPFTVTPVRPDTIFRFTPYAAGEALRPEARIQAAPTEGVPPLAVSFQAVTAATRADWDLGDGTKATGRTVRHTYAQPGVYTVTLTATDAGGGVAVAQTEIVTEHETAEPLVRVGFASGERPALRFHGTAKRGADGALVLPADAPWGWVQAGDGPLEELRGLRSFTISGWVRPTSLTVGAGGNRLVFCLNRDGDGIDLVCHADGRLRLAVNQWPDGIRNDSSPGKLILGKWTFFAVTYDANRSQENVSWHFSPPLDAPVAADVRLDRKTSYNNGPVGAGLRGLAIGNFNQTMHSYGLDRQFRGEIRGLQIFGSRISGRGALNLEAISRHVRVWDDWARDSAPPGSVKNASGSVQSGPDAVGFKTIQIGTRPESVTKGFGGHYYVTVMGDQQPGDAVIKVMKGEQVEVFATGMDEPKGIAFVGGFLVTTDLKRVWKIDAQGNKTVLADEKDFPTPISYLNDTAAAPDGQGVFVTDMGARDKIMGSAGLWPLDSAEAKALPAIGRIYHISLEGRVRLVLDAAPDMACPNGVCAPAMDRLLVAEFFHGNLLQALNGKLEILNTGFRGADGIECAKTGEIFVSSWTQGKVWKLDRRSQNPQILIEGLQSAADFYLDEPARLMLVPDMKAGTIVYVPLL